MIADLWLPYPPSVNAYYGRNRYTVYVKKAGKDYTSAVQEAVADQCPGLKFEGPVSVVIRLCPPLTRRKRDLDNCLKILLDSLTSAGLWDDDSQVTELRVCWGDERQNACNVAVRAAL